MFLRSHRASIDVHIRVNFDCCDLQTGSFQKQTGGRGWGGAEHNFSFKMLHDFVTKRRTNNALSNSTNDTTRNDNVLGHVGHKGRDDSRSRCKNGVRAVFEN